MAAATFAEAISVAAIDVPRAALLYARQIAYPDLDVDGYVLRLGDLAAQAAHYAGEGSPSDRAEALGLFLFGELGFAGNVDAYYAPDNSYLNRVLDSKLGIPITLSLIYIEIAESLGLAVHGVGLPGHFLVGVETGDPDEIAYIDSFHGGLRRSRSECARLVAQATGYPGPFDDEWLRPLSERAILGRMLRNLVNAHTQREEWTQVAAVLEHLQQLEPDDPTHFRDLGLVRVEARQFRLAVQSLETYLVLNPRAADAAAIRQRITDLRGFLARLN